MHLTIAGTTVPIERAVGLVSGYATEHPRTLTVYDGRAHGAIREWRKYTPADIEAARVIERRAITQKVAETVLVADLPWAEVPKRTIDLEDVGPDSRSYAQLSRFYVALRSIDGVGPAVATKLMYLRWPAATPIQDSLLEALYREAAAAKYAELRATGTLPPVVTDNGWRRLYLLAVRDDLLAARESGALARLREDLGDVLAADAGAKVEALSDCRLIDILAWSLRKGR